ncbi:MAG: 30S ribosome-binding factor RbfA [Candidatus Cloacimonetes bacterium]|nr:30S ribosome-binding factor RbfA [Candidatus Cloacimonadota bacterium]
MAQFRQNRLSSLIKQTVAKIVRFDLRDKRVKNVVIKDVKVSVDLHYATIYFSILNGDMGKKSAQKGLDRAKKYIRMRLAKSLNLKYTPELNFVYDTISQNARSIERLIEEERKKYDIR